jgi:limonene-1,2-epoxide hydrolase
MSDSGSAGTVDSPVVDTIHALWRGVYEQDWEEIKRHLHDECIYFDVPVGPGIAAKGPANVIKRLKLAIATTSGYEGHPGAVVTDGRHATYEHSETWTWPSEESVTLPFVSVHEIRDGKIALWKDYWDLNTFTSACPSDWFSSLADGGGDMSWIYDATGDL